MIRRTTNLTATVPISFRIATEHFNWAKTAGMSNAAIMLSIGLPATGKASDVAVIDGIERTWLAMQAGFRARPLAPANHHMRRAAE